MLISLNLREGIILIPLRTQETIISLLAIQLSTFFPRRKYLQILANRRQNGSE
jgi:hypothetical protein